MDFLWELEIFINPMTIGDILQTQYTDDQLMGMGLHPDQWFTVGNDELSVAGNASLLIARVQEAVTNVLKLDLSSGKGSISMCGIPADAGNKMRVSVEYMGHCRGVFVTYGTLPLNSITVERYASQLRLAKTAVRDALWRVVPHSLNYARLSHCAQISCD